MRQILSRLQLVGIIIGFAISSWLLIHVFSILGVFLALAYPMWWFFAPRQTICLFCRSRSDGDTCPLCQRNIRKSDGNYAKTFLSSICNGGIILAFSFLSIGVVYVESQTLHSLGFVSVPLTAFFTAPATSQYAIGEIFPMKLEVNGITTPINTVQADISFDPTKLEVVNISTVDSFATIFIDKEIDNDKGFARLSGGLPNPGFSGNHGLFGTVYFKGKETGPVNVKFLPSTSVLANDGEGSNVLKDYGTISYLITPQQQGQPQDNRPGINVLGASTSSGSSTQMIFYDDQDVLGAQTQTTSVHQGQIASVFSTTFSILGRVDSFIVSFWQHLFG